MKKNRFFTCSKICALALIGVSALFLASCAKDGFTEETFVSTVTNSTLSSPELTKANFGTQMNSDGSESIVVTWKVVPGAGGYAYEAYNVDDPANPIELVKGVTDNPTFTFPKAEDTRYQVIVKTLGNTKLNNTEAPEPTVFAYSTMIDAKIIPDGSDIAEFIKANMTDSEDEQAFELVAGGNYTCNSAVDFQMNKMTLRGDKITHPIVTMGANGTIQTCAQLKVKWINFDCTEVTDKWGIIQTSASPSELATATAQKVNAGKNNNQPADVYILQDPIIVQECAFKNVPSGLVSTNDYSWGLADVRVLNCIVQLNNDGNRNGNGAVICAVSNGMAPSGGNFWYGCIKNITIKESTIYNIKTNGKNRMFRFNNKDIDRVFPSAEGTCVMMDNTFIRVMDNKEFGNNTPNHNKYVITYDNNIFYDSWRLQKFIQGNCVVNWHQEQNTIWGVKNAVDGTDKSKWATEEDAGFSADETVKELDFTKEDFGINFKATGAISSKIGDPRWRE